jgi:hypothetical protein
MFYPTTKRPYLDIDIDNVALDEMWHFTSNEIALDIDVTFGYHPNQEGGGYHEARYYTVLVHRCWYSEWWHTEKAEGDGVIQRLFFDTYAQAKNWAISAGFDHS